MSASMQTVMHISSLIVHARSEHLSAIVAGVEALDGAEVHGVSELGKLVVTLETGDEAEILERIAAISEITGVLSVALVFHQVEDTQD